MINNSTNGLKPVDVVPKRIQIKPNDPRTAADGSSNNSPVTIEIQFVNEFPCEVIVVDRNGFRFKVPAKPKHQRAGTFRVRTIYKISERAYNDCKVLFAGLRGSASEELRIIHDAVSHEDREHYHATTVIVDHCVEFQKLHELNSSLYLPNVDLVISCLPINDAPAHPMAVGTVDEDHWKESIGKGQVGYSFGIGIVMVNREVGARPMFASMMNTIRTIPISIDPNRKHGFYITTLDRTINKTNMQNLSIEYFPLEDSTKIGIYASKELAESAGNITLLKEAEIANLKHETVRLTIQSNNDKAMFDTENAIRAQSLQDQLDKLTRDDKRREMEHVENVRINKEEILTATRKHENATKQRQNEHDILMKKMELEKEELKAKNESRSEKIKLLIDVGKIILPTLGIIGGILKLLKKSG